MVALFARFDQCRQDIIAETTKFNVETFTTSRNQQLRATLCNPTEDSFVIHSFTTSALLEGSELLRAKLAHKVRKRSLVAHTEHSVKQSIDFGRANY